MPIQRYLPTTGPKALENDIQKLLSLPDIAASDSATTPAATAAAEGSCATDGSVAK